MPFLAQEGGAIHAQFKSFTNTSLWVILAVALVALVFAAYLRRMVLEAPEGTDKMKEIAHAIRDGRPAHPGFDTALRHHRQLDAIERAALTGTRQHVSTT